MKLWNKTALVAATFALVLGQAVAVQATPAPSFNISLQGGNLRNSTISGFSEDQLLSLSLSVPSGQIIFNYGASSATLISDSNVGSNLLIQGTQAQLRTVFDAISFSEGCGGDIQLSARVDAGGGLKNEVNGHYYRLVKTRTSFNGAINLASQATFDGTPSGSRGYLATITNKAENDFLYTVMGGAGNNAWIAASDRDLEGDWKWVTGPEKGTVFYRGVFWAGGAVNGGFSGWAGGEPNQAGDEDYAEVYGSGQWNDIPSYDDQNYYLIEWGGMPGDNFTSAVTLSDTATYGQVAFSGGTGTQSSPYQVSSAYGLSKVAACSGYGVYFKQTADINLTGTDFSPIGTENKYFQGSYDGGNHLIQGVSVNSSTKSLFGLITGYDNIYTQIKNLRVSGEMNVRGANKAGLVAASAKYTDFTNVHVSVAANISGYSEFVGGLVGQAEESTITNSSVTGTATVADSYSVGGLVGFGKGVSIDEVSSSIDMSGSAYAARVGGIAGLLSWAESGRTSHLSNAKFTGELISSSWEAVGGLTGQIQGNSNSISRSYSTGPVSGSNYVGGLIGVGYEPNISESFATGDVTAAGAIVGGLAGYLCCAQVSDSYSSGSVTGVKEVGALIGVGEGVVLSRVYSISPVTFVENNRGLIGLGSAFVNGDSFWTPEKVGVSESSFQPMGSESAISVAQAKSISTYQNAEWSIGDFVTNTDSTWAIARSLNDGFPILRHSAEDGVWKHTFVVKVDDGLVQAPAVPVRPGYDFQGWSLLENGTAVSFPFAAVSQDTTLYALWTLSTFTVTYNTTGGTPVAAGSFVYLSDVESAPRSPRRIGFVFNGWSAENGGSAISFPYSPGVASNITLYARWTALPPVMSTSKASNVAPGDIVSVNISRVNPGCTVTVGWTNQDSGVRSVSKVVKASRSTGAFTIATPSTAGVYTLRTDRIESECYGGSAVTLAKRFLVGKSSSISAKVASTSGFVSKNPELTVSGFIKSGTVNVANKQITISLRRDGSEVSSKNVSTDSSGVFSSTFTGSATNAGLYTAVVTVVGDATYIETSLTTAKITLR
jgi:uncharacterized repeat protein (TIGR02543 family)